MNPEAILRVENYNLRKLSKTCNFGECAKLPSKETIILEVDGKSKRELVAIYFCAEHYNKNMHQILEKLSSACEKGKFIDKKVFDIGYITY